MNRFRSFKPAGAAGILAVLLPIAPAAGSDDAVRHLPATARIAFNGSSTLHDFGGQLGSAPFTLVISNGTWSARSTVAAADMATGHDGRDGKMHAMMQAADHPVLQGTVTAAPVPGPGNGTATLRLRIRDRETDIPVRISRWEETAGTVRFHAEWTVSLKAYGLRPPSVLGVIRVADTVRLESDVVAGDPIGIESSASQALPTRHE